MDFKIFFPFKMANKIRLHKQCGINKHDYRFKQFDEQGN